MTDLLMDRTAVVTGASSGIGRSIATTYARHGADVVIADVREEPREGGRPTHELIAHETDASATYVDCDVSDVSDLEATMEAADELGGVDVLVNNAGIFRAEEFLDVTPEEYRRLMDVNVMGAFFASQLAARRMVDGDGGTSSTSRASPVSSATGATSPTASPRARSGC